MEDKKLVTKPTNDEQTLLKLKALGFSDDPVETPRRLIVSLEGRERTGKTTFACSGDDPVIFFNIDIGTEGVVGKVQAKGKKVYIYDVRVRKGDNQSTYVSQWNDLRQRLILAYSLKKGTVVLDTSTEAYELARLAHFGKLTQVMPHNYTEVNNEWRELLRLAYDARTMNTVFIHKMKPKWVNNARTNEYEMSGFSEMAYMSQVNLLLYREKSDEEDGAPVFCAYIKDSRHKPSITGRVLRGPMCNLNFLTSLVHN